MSTHRWLINDDYVAIMLQGVPHKIKMKDLCKYLNDFYSFNYDDYIPYSEFFAKYKEWGVIPHFNLIAPNLYYGEQINWGIADFKFLSNSSSAYKILNNPDFAEYSVGGIVKMSGMDYLGVRLRTQQSLKYDLFTMSCYNGDYIIELYNGFVSNETKGLSFEVWSMMGEGVNLYFTIDSFFTNTDGKTVYKLVYSKKSDPYSCMSSFLYASVDPNYKELGHEYFLSGAFREGRKFLKSTSSLANEVEELGGVGLETSKLTENFFRKTKLTKVDLTASEGALGKVILPDSIKLTENGLGVPSQGRTINLSDDTSFANSFNVTIKQKIYESEVAPEQDLTPLEVAMSRIGIIEEQPLGVTGYIFEDEFVRGVMFTPNAEWGIYEDNPEELLGEEFCKLWLDSTGIDLIYQAKNGIIEATGEKVTVGALLCGYYLGDNKWHVNRELPMTSLDTTVSQTFIREKEEISYYDFSHNMGGFNFENKVYTNYGYAPSLHILSSRNNMKNYDIRRSYPLNLEINQKNNLFMIQTLGDLEETPFPNSHFYPCLFESIRSGNPNAGEYYRWFEKNPSGKSYMSIIFDSGCYFNQLSSSFEKTDQNNDSLFLAGIINNGFLITKIKG